MCRLAKYDELGIALNFGSALFIEGFTGTPV